MKNNLMFNYLKYLFIIVSVVFINVASADEAEVKKFVEKVASNIVTVVKKSNTSDHAKARKLLKIIKANFDTEWMAKFALGRDYRTLSAKEKKRYTALYEDYLKNTYFPILMKYENEIYEVTKVIKTGANHYNASVRITKPGRTPIDLDYTTKYKNGKYKLLDMSIEGVSTIYTQRSEFSAVVQQSGMKSLFDKLEQTELES